MGNLGRLTLTAPGDLYITGELDRRPVGASDPLGEKLALQDLAARMVDQPEEVLPRFVDLAMALTGGISAGLSLYEENPAPGIFRWRYLRGTLSPFDGATTPRDFSPCGITLDQNQPVLSLHPERFYDWISDASIVVPEVLSSGNHEQIRKWRREQALRKTLRNRPDLLRDAVLSADDRTFLRRLATPTEDAQSNDSV